MRKACVSGDVSTKRVRLNFTARRYEAFDRPADRSLAHPNCANSIEELAPLAVGSPGPSVDVFLKQQHGTLIELRRLTQPPLWSKRAALVTILVRRSME
jgi:hypothetical protein